MREWKVLMRYLKEHVPVAVEGIHLRDLEAMGIFFTPCDINTLTESAWSDIRIRKTHPQTLKRFFDSQAGSLISIMFKDRLTLRCAQP